jgi:2-iminobutanoate/2-iminopropanoate deaminase
LDDDTRIAFSAAPSGVRNDLWTQRYHVTHSIKLSFWTNLATSIDPLVHVLREETMLKLYNPQSIAAPAGAYSHGIEVAPNSRWLYIAGQIGVNPDGSVPSSVEEQTEIVWRNMLAVLNDGGMGIPDLVKITSFLTRSEDFAKFAPIRAKYLGHHRPASTVLIVSALAKPEFRVEIEAVAAKMP